MTNFFPSKQ